VAKNDDAPQPIRARRAGRGVVLRRFGVNVVRSGWDDDPCTFRSWPATDAGCTIHQHRMRGTFPCSPG